MNVQQTQRRNVPRALATAPWRGAVPPPRVAEEGARADTFDAGRVRLLGGPFKRAEELASHTLRSVQADRLLHPFRVNAGLPPKAPAGGGWGTDAESQDLRCQGHALGRYLSACSMMWAATGEAEFRRRADHVVRELHTCQQAARSGLVCAFPDGDTQLRNGLAGRAVTGLPWDTLQELAAGLRDAHVHAGSALALEVLRRLADWIESAAEGCDDARLRLMLDVELGGMNEVMADLAALTGETRYLALARRFGDRGPRAIATSGRGDGEPFFAPAEMHRHLDSAWTMQTCGVHDMLHLTRVPLRGAARVEDADWTERALINGMLASQDPGSGMGHHARDGATIFAAGGDVLCVTQYIAAELAWREKGLRVSQVTAFPERSRVRLLFAAERVTSLTLRLRHPSWCRALSVRVSGQPVLESRQPGRWVDLARSWRNGDTVDIELPMHLHLMPQPRASGVAALMYGPMVLAARMGTDASVPQRPAMPRLALGGRALHEAVRQVGSELRFRAPCHGSPDLELLPYHQVAHEQCSTYVELA